MRCLTKYYSCNNYFMIMINIKKNGDNKMNNKITNKINNKII